MGKQKQKLTRKLQIEPVGTSHPSFQDPETRCSYCGRKGTKMRCTGKKSQTYKCNVCNAKLVQLHGIFGHWPTDQFKAQNEAAKQEFMRNIADCTSSTEVQIVANQMLEGFEKHADYYDEGGQYLPLSV